MPIDQKERELQEALLRSDRTQKRRRDAKNAAWKIYVAAREALARRRQITKARRIRLREYRAAKLDGPDVAIKWALEQVGVKEQPAGSNSGPKIRDWQAATLGQGSTGWPWCQAFVNAAYVKGGGVQFHSAYTPQFVNWAAAKQNGLRIVPAAERRKGDFVYFDFDGGVVDHVGLYIGGGRTVEGNTSSSNAGSQDNGGCVAIRERPASQIRCYVRPPYKK